MEIGGEVWEGVFFYSECTMYMLANSKFLSRCVYFYQTTI